MHQDAQQHNRVSTETIVLAQQAKEASTYEINGAENRTTHEQVNISKS